MWDLICKTVDLVRVLSLFLGWGPFTVSLSEDSYNLVMCLLSSLDDRDVWESSGLPLTDNQWIGVTQLLSLAQWELQTEVSMGGLTYVDRGDPADMDYTIANLTANSAWHNLDLSAIVTDADAVLVHLWTQIQDGVTGGIVSYRKDGNVNTRNILSTRIAAAGILQNLDGLVALGANRIIEYYLTTGIDLAYILVRGWWKPA